MLVELLVAFFFVLLLSFVLWALFGLLLLPVFSGNMLTLLFASGHGGTLEMRVRAYSWLRENKKRGGRLVIVDCGLSHTGLEIAQQLRKKWPWVDYCPNQALTDYIELMQHCLENSEEL